MDACNGVKGLVLPAAMKRCPWHAADSTWGSAGRWLAYTAGPRATAHRMVREPTGMHMRAWDRAYCTPLLRDMPQTTPLLCARAAGTVWLNTPPLQLGCACASTVAN